MKVVIKSIADICGTTDNPDFNPMDCAVSLHVDIGPDVEDGATIFNLLVVTHSYLSKSQRAEWGSGLLVVKKFDWNEVEDELHAIVKFVQTLPLDEANDYLRKYMHWEYDPVGFIRDNHSE